MKSKIYLILCLAFISTGLLGQRYVQEVFSEVDVELNKPYGENMAINFATGGLDTSTLVYDIYTPTGDTETDRPLVLIAHTGSFLPPVINGQATGQRADSTVVEVCKRLAKRGFVAVAYTYRLGWRPDATADDLRKGSLLQAAYRGIQDTRACIRFFRKETDVNNNPFGIDPDKIAVWGIGTGGYLAAGAATLDRYEEVILGKFLSEMNTPYIDTTLLGNLYGTTNKPGCIANHVGYSSDISFSYNLGGALGDLEWIQDGNIPPMAGVHCLQDAFAPFYVGNVIVPTTGAIVIDNAAGTRGFVEKVNAVGANSIFEQLTVMTDPLKPISDAYSQVDIMWGPLTIKLGENNMYPFLQPRGEGSPWDWWGLQDLENLVAFINTQSPTPYDAQKIHSDGLLTNMDMSAEKGRRFLDTIFIHATPRLCLSMDLGCFEVSVEDLDESEVLSYVGPNPASDIINIETAVNYPLRSVHLYNSQGQLVKANVKMNAHSYSLQRNGLPSGVYIAELGFDEGRVTKKLTFQ